MPTYVDNTNYGAPSALADAFSGWAGSMGAKRNKEKDLADIAKTEAETAEIQRRAAAQAQRTRELQGQLPQAEIGNLGPNYGIEQPLNEQQLRDQDLLQRRIYRVNMGESLGDLTKSTAQGPFDPSTGKYLGLSDAENVSYAQQFPNKLQADIDQSLASAASSNASAAKTYSEIGQGNASDWTSHTIMGENGMPKIISRNRLTGEVQEVGPGMPPAGTHFEVGPDNTITFSQGVGVGDGAAELGTKPRNTAQTEAIQTGQTLNSIKQIEKLLEGNDDLFNIPKKKWNELMQFKEGFTGKMSPEQKDYTARRNRLMVQVGQSFNKYRKLITGAAAALSELETLKKDYIDKNMTKTDFTTRVKALIDIYENDLAYLQYTIREGIDPVRNADGRVSAEAAGWEPGNAPGAGPQTSLAGTAEQQVPKLNNDGPEVMFAESNDGPPMMSIDGGKTWRTQ